MLRGVWGELDERNGDWIELCFILYMLEFIKKEINIKNQEQQK